MNKRKAKSDAPFAVPNWPAAKVEMRALSKIKDYPSNPRTHPESQIDALATLMKKYGPDQPIVVDENSVILKGHGRKQSAIKAGFEEFPVVVHVGLSENDKRAVRISDNQIALLSSWNPELLRLEVSELKLAGFDMPLLGFDSFQLAEIMTPPNEGATDPDEAPEPPKNPVVRKGDLWLLGEHHRLLCGDATNADDVAKVLGTDKPNLMVVDPPYGVDYDADWRNRADRANGKPYGASAIGKVSNDDRGDWSAAWKLFPGDVVYSWHPPGARQVEHYAALIASGFEVRMQIIWAKQQFPIGRGNYHVQHEPCWYAVRKGKTANWQGDRKQSTLWQIDKPHKSETGHSTQKPIECMKRPIENNSRAGEYVYDPFVGSFTTGIACEMTGRKCLAIEIDPAYVQVCIERFEKFSGKTATLDGLTLAQVAKARRKPTPQAQPATRAPKRERAAQAATPS